MNIKNSHKSFTLIELILVVAIILLFSGLLLPQYGVLSEQFRLKTEAGKLKDILELARKKTITRELISSCTSGFTGYEVYVKSNGYDLSSCCADTCNRNTPIQAFRLNPQTNSLISIVSGIGYLQFIPSMPGIAFVKFRSSLSDVPPYPNTDIVIMKNASIPTGNQCLQITISNVGIVAISDTLISCP